MSSMSTCVVTACPLRLGSRPQRDLELAVERVGDAQERVDLRRTAAGFKPRDCGLRRVTELRQLLLGETARAPVLYHLIGDPREEPVALPYSDHAISCYSTTAIY